MSANSFANVKLTSMSKVPMDIDGQIVFDSFVISMDVYDMIYSEM